MLTIVIGLLMIDLGTRKDIWWVTFLGAALIVAQTIHSKYQFEQLQKRNRNLREQVLYQDPRRNSR